MKDEPNDIVELRRRVAKAKELEHSMADAYAVNKVRRAYKDIEDTWEDVRARCS